jgi:hypothetical protein
MKITNRHVGEASTVIISFGLVNLIFAFMFSVGLPDFLGGNFLAIQYALVFTAFFFVNKFALKNVFNKDKILVAITISLLVIYFMSSVRINLQSNESIYFNDKTILEKSLVTAMNSSKDKSYFHYLINQLKEDQKDIEISHLKKKFLFSNQYFTNDYYRITLDEKIIIDSVSKGMNQYAENLLDNYEDKLKPSLILLEQARLLTPKSEVNYKVLTKEILEIKNIRNAYHSVKTEPLHRALKAFTHYCNINPSIVTSQHTWVITQISNFTS